MRSKKYHALKNTAAQAGGGPKYLQNAHPNTQKSMESTIFIAFSSIFPLLKPVAARKYSRRACIPAEVGRCGPQILTAQVTVTNGY